MFVYFFVCLLHYIIINIDYNYYYGIHYMQDKGNAVSNLFLLEHVLGNHYHRFFFNSQRILGECIMYTMPVYSPSK